MPKKFIIIIKQFNKLVVNMTTLTTIFFSLVSLSFLSLATFMLTYSYYQNYRELPVVSQESEFLTLNTVSPPLEKVLEFNNPALAFKVLSDLDLYKPVNLSIKTNYGLPIVGLKSNDDYCEK